MHAFGRLSLPLSPILPLLPHSLWENLFTAAEREKRLCEKFSEERVGHSCSAVKRCLKLRNIMPVAARGICREMYEVSY